MKKIKASELHKHVPKLEDIAPDVKIPDFNSDQEERDWLDANHKRLAALADKHGVLVKFEEREPTKQISIRLPVTDLEHARRIAKTRKVKYQSVLRRAFREGLQVVAK